MLPPLMHLWRFFRKTFSVSSCTYIFAYLSSFRSYSSTGGRLVNIERKSEMRKKKKRERRKKRRKKKTI